MTSIAAEALTPEAFEPFGRVIALPDEEPHATGAGWRWWAETVLLEGDGRAWGVGYLDLLPTEPRFDWAERHMRTQEAILATTAEILIYVAPPDHLEEPDRLPELSRFRAFTIPARAGVVLDRAVWHGAPFTLGGAAAALVLILEGTGREDVTVVRFPESPVDVELNGQ